MPVGAIAGVAVVVVVMLIVVPLMIKRTKAMTAQGGVAFDSGLATLGLRPTQHTGEQTRYEGDYRGRHVVMETDASAVTKATKLGGGLAMLGGIASAAGVGAATAAVNKGVGMAAATGKAIKMTWTVALAAPVRGSVTVTRAPADGLSPWGDGMHAQFDAGAAQAMSDASVQQALAATRFSKITASGQQVQLVFAPSLEQYTSTGLNTPAGLTALSQSALDAVSTLCDRLAS